ncbi:MAG: thermonuclease family protein [Syntrophaceae bacterium]|nr:thermonuclease family protein [Syntrophaceae bacterium]
MTTLTAQQTYEQLLTAVQTEIAQGKGRIQDAVEREKVTTYWRLGRLLAEHLLDHKERADYGERLFERLSGDLSINRRILYQTVRFYEAYPILNARSQLGWAHYRALITVKDDSKRASYEIKAKREGWTSRELEGALKRDKVVTTLFPQPRPASRTGETPSPQRLPLKRGRPYTYRLIEPAFSGPLGGRVFVDCGFNVWKDAELSGISRPKKGDIIEAEKGNDLFGFRSSDAAPSELYTYKAFVEKVIDGDTLWAVIDCSFDTWVRQKLRLRAIDTPELSSARGERAKRFVERALKGAPFIIIKTYQSDKYDRYLADVFYLSAGSVAGPAGASDPDPHSIAREGVFLNQQLVDEGLARVVG